MNGICKTALCAVLVAATAGCGDGDGQLFYKHIPAPSLRGNIVNEPADQPIVVYLPPGYTYAAESYPVVYFLPGYDTAVDAFLDGTFQGFSLVEAMDRLIAEGKIRKMIVVLVNGKSALGGSFFANSPVTGKWENFLIRDVVRYVDENYKTLAFRETRGIAGHSSGGTAALHIAMRHPDVFSAVYAMSPGLFDGEVTGYHVLFGGEEIVASLLEKKSEWEVMPREAAHSDYMSYIGSMLKSGEPVDVGCAFVCAYGAAFCPDPDANAPYTVFPFGGDGMPGTSVGKEWEWGFGGIGERIRMYKEKELELAAIELEVGSRDSNEWIISGCKYVSWQLSQAGISNDLAEFDGGHEDKLRQRIEEHVLPFFSDVLGLE